MRLKRRIGLVVLTAACGGPGTTHGTFEVTPAKTKVLSCGTQDFDAIAGETPVTNVAWSVTPAHAGTIDQSGLYTAPRHALSAPVTIEATHLGDRETAIADVLTAWPGVRSPINSTVGRAGGVTDHAAASRGSRVYVAWPVANGTTVGIDVARSDNAGGKFKGAVPALSTTAQAASVDCVSIAIDAGNSDVVYALARIDDTNAIASAKGATGPTVVLAVSADGGTSFLQYVIWAGKTAGGPNIGWDTPGICPDVVSPSPDHVVVEIPGSQNCSGQPDMGVWADSGRGAGFTSGVTVNSDYVAAGATQALDNVNNAAGCSDRLAIGQDVSTDLTGGTVESPRLFADGGGALCVTYIGSDNATRSIQHAYVQCGGAAATSFSAPIMLDPADGASLHSTAVGAFGPGGRAAVAWVESDGKLHVAVSLDGGATFGTPATPPLYAVPTGTVGARTPSLAYDAGGVLWVAYLSWDGIDIANDRIAVDKTCDDGATWSGSLLAAGPETEPPGAGAAWPALLPTSGNAPSLLVHDEATHALSMIQLAP